MSNKRILKRDINLLCEELFTECIAATLYGNNTESGKALLFSIIKLQSEFTCRISHPEPGMPAKIYFKTLREDFVSKVSEIVDQINNL